jgi:transposase
VVERVFRAGRPVRIQARTWAPEAVCPGCGFSSRWVHSRYERRLCDSPVAGRETIIHLRVRRFFCRNGDCAKKTFAEQVPGLTIRHGRRSEAMTEVLRAVALSLDGRAGARLTARLDIPRL